MGRTFKVSILAGTAMIVSTSALAQDGSTKEPSAPVTRADMIKPQESTGNGGTGPQPAPMEELVTSGSATAEPVPNYKTAANGSACELHVWPTENYIGIKMGLLSGFGPLGALADMEGNKGEVRTVKDLMEDYLGPQIQLEELERLNFAEKLKVGDYKMVIQEPSPSHEDAKADPEIKAKAKAMNKTIKAKQRLSDSTAPCYAELFTTHIFYHKAMMYGSNLFTGWIYREFEGPKQIKVGKGQVKNPLEHFPPKTAEDVEKAQVELRDAYSKDFTEYVEKKVFKVKKRR